MKPEENSCKESVREKGEGGQKRKEGRRKQNPLAKVIDRMSYLALKERALGSRSGPMNYTFSLLTRS